MPRPVKTLEDLAPGDRVWVKDTSNGKTLEAYFRAHRDHRLDVWVTRFANSIQFSEDGTTKLGRFTLHATEPTT